MNKASGLGAGVIAALVFLLAFLVLDLGLVVSLVAAIAGFGAGWLLFPSKKPEAVTDVKEALTEARQKLVRFRAAGREVSKPAVAQNVKEIGEVIESILDTVADDPKKYKPAKQFLNYYLDAAVKIVSMYGELAAKNVRDDDIKSSLDQVEATLGTLKDAFAKQLAQLLAGEVMDLDAELTLLKQTITMEGLGKQP